MVRNNFKEGTVLQEKMSRGTWRTVLVKDQRIYKHFTRVRWPGDLRKPWRLEAKALIHLREKGIECPRFLSLHEEGGEAVLCKEFVCGEPLSKISSNNVELIAENLARINAAGVFTCDPHVSNFLEVAADKIIFVDYGRSRIFKNRLQFFLFYLGKERARISFLLLGGADTHLEESFWAAYTKSLGVIKDPLNIVRLSEKHWLQQMQKRKPLANDSH